MSVHKGEEGVKNVQKTVHIVFGCTLTCFSLHWLIFIRESIYLVYTHIIIINKASLGINISLYVDIFGHSN